MKLGQQLAPCGRGGRINPTHKNGAQGRGAFLTKYQWPSVQWDSQSFHSIPKLFAASVPPSSLVPLLRGGGFGMSEQFAPIPIRASADTRLGGPDFRLLVRIAYYDRLGRNGANCYVNARKLAKEAGIHYKHLGRQADRLEAFGYIKRTSSETDKRRKIYSVIYDEAEKITCGGDNLTDDPSGTDSPSAHPEIVTTRGDDSVEKVTKSKSQAVDSPMKSVPKRSSEAYLRDPAKPCVRNGKNATRYDSGKPKHIARQWVGGGGNGRVQENMMLPIQRNTLTLQEKSGESDWNGWATWLQQYLGMTSEAAWNWLMDEQTRIADERGINPTEAGAILDRDLKRLRARLRDEPQYKAAAHGQLGATPSGNAVSPNRPAI